MKRICHITTVHQRYDIRIFHKECTSLAKEYDVSLIVADGLKNETINNVNIIDIGLRQKSRLKRIFIDSNKAFKKAKALNCDVYHFHDPELIPIGLKLLKKGKKVIYDAHEDVPRQFMGRTDLKPSFLKPIFIKFFESYENRAIKKFSAVIAATPFINKRFIKLNKNSNNVNNYPIINEFSTKANWKAKKQAACYIGQLSEIKGFYSLIESVSSLDGKLLLAGEFDNPHLKDKIKELNSSKINEHGFVNREEVQKILNQSKVGIVTFLPVPNYVNAQPIKMYEYMAAGLPIVASNFPLWKEIIEKNNCGICVDPTNPQEIAKTINNLLNDDELAEKMGKNGRKAIEEKYNWGNEEKKLLKIYDNLLNN